MNRRSFLAVVSALIALPRLINNHIAEAYQDSLPEPDLAPRPETRKPIVLHDTNGDIVKTAFCNPAPLVECPILTKDGEYTATLFGISTIDPDGTHHFVYERGPRFWEHDYRMNTTELT